jgi:hypothetical protein
MLFPQEAAVFLAAEAVAVSEDIRAVEYVIAPPLDKVLLASHAHASRNQTLAKLKTHIAIFRGIAGQV